MCLASFSLLSSALCLLVLRLVCGLSCELLSCVSSVSCRFLVLCLVLSLLVLCPLPIVCVLSVYNFEKPQFPSISRLSICFNLFIESIYLLKPVYLICLVHLVCRSSLSFSHVLPGNFVARLSACKIGACGVSSCYQRGKECSFECIDNPPHNHHNERNFQAHSQSARTACRHVSRYHR